MNEIIFSGLFKINTVSASGNDVLIIGKLESGNLATGWKAKIGNKVVEIKNISIQAIEKNVTLFVIVKGGSIEDFNQLTQLEFKTVIL